ncbi:hypothetical protein [Demequina phytophila]|uniref:hypothetical protein n=1 Tax=Demequina phytophila TaxID=1638981 RepID=UPI0007840F38|nr:hypothetical protein [Demequina phytophila]
MTTATSTHRALVPPGYRYRDAGCALREDGRQIGSPLIHIESGATVGVARCVRVDVHGNPLEWIAIAQAEVLGANEFGVFFGFRYQREAFAKLAELHRSRT